MKRKLNLRTTMLAFFVLPGTVLLFCSLADILFRIPDIIVLVVGGCMLVFWLFVLAMLFRGKSETEDEMAVKNQSHAMMCSWNITVLELAGCEIYVIFTGKQIPLPANDLFAFLLASMFLIYGVMFLVLDK